MQLANAANLDRKSGVAQWRDLRFLLPGSQTDSEAMDSERRGRGTMGAAPWMPYDPNQIRDGMRRVPCLPPLIPLLMTQVRTGRGECRAYGARIIFGIGPTPAGLG